MARRALCIDDVTRVVSVSDPRISPDGAYIAYTVSTVDLEANETRSAIWIVLSTGGEPRRLTIGTKHDTEPRWSPDGHWIAFISDREGTKQIYRLPFGSGEPEKLTDHPIGVSDLAWSPDGTSIAFLAAGPDVRGAELPLVEKDDKKRLVLVTRHRHKHDGAGFRGPASRHVWIVPAEGGPAEQITDGPFDDSAPAWSPEGTRIAFISDRSDDRDNHYEGGAIHVVHVETRDVQRVTDETGRAANPAWSLDGMWLAYVGSPVADDASASDTHLWIIPADGGTPTNLTESIGRAVGQRAGGYLSPSRPVWAGLEGPIYYLIGTGGSTHLWCVESPFEDPVLTQVTVGLHTAGEFSSSANGDEFALAVSDPVAPNEVWAWDEIDGLRQLTRHNGEWLDEVTLDEPRHIVLQRPDGLEIEGWLLPPSSAQSQIDDPKALVQFVHGGPHNYFGYVWNFDHQLAAAQDYTVLYVNPRGSGGYGEEFASAVIGDWGGGDYQDQMAVLDHVLTQNHPTIDPSRLAITGGSYGGFMTCWAVGQTDRFAVGIAGASVTNLISMFGTSDIGASWAVREFQGTPFEQLDWYLAHSPLTYADQITTPLFLYHGENDLRCPIEQSEQMFTALKKLGKTTEFLRIPAEYHASLNGSPVHRVEVRRQILNWLARYLDPPVKR